MSHLRVEIEQALASSIPFGSAEYILGQLCTHYLKRLQGLDGHAPGARTLSDSLRNATPGRRLRVVGDPIVRTAIDTAILHLRSGGPPFPDEYLGTVFNAANNNLKGDSNGPPLSEHAGRPFRLQEGHGSTWIWSKDRSPQDRLGTIFRKHFESLQGRFLHLTTPSQHHLQTLRAGFQALNDLFPNLSNSVMDHVQMILVVDADSPKFNSLTDSRIPSTIIISGSMLQTPWQAAEHLLHEALHVKFVDLVHTHSLLSADYVDLISPKIRPIWHVGHSGSVPEWTIERALTVMHVYVGLALFFDAIECEKEELQKRHGPLGDLDPGIRRQHSLDRARYLGDKLRDHTKQLGAAGTHFLRWLAAILGALHSPPSIQRGHAI